ncbi:MAG: hypothetical protein ACLP7Q_07635 [Isosphaeraceae bacterium]
MPFAERLCVTLGVEDAVAAVVEEVLGPLEALEDPCRTDPTESSESAASGLVESNEVDVGLLEVAWVVPSAPDVVEEAGAEPADVEGSERALEDPMGDEFETAESGPWVLAEALPPEAAVLYPEDEAEVPGVGAATPGLVPDVAGTDDAVLPDDDSNGAETAVPDEIGTDDAVPDDDSNGAETAVPDEVGIDAAVPEVAGIDAAVLAEAGADAGADAVILAEAGIVAAELGVLAAVAAGCWPFGRATRFCAAVTPIG